jgi:hypothetical protein
VHGGESTPASQVLVQRWHSQGTHTVWFHKEDASFVFRNLSCQNSIGNIGSIIPLVHGIQGVHFDMREITEIPSNTRPPSLRNVQKDHNATVFKRWKAFAFCMNLAASAATSIGKSTASVDVGFSGGSRCRQKVTGHGKIFNQNSCESKSQD